MKQKFLTLFVALLATIALWAQNNVITYTATAKLTSSTLTVGSTTFGPAITSHTFSNGIGTITCSGEITTIGDEAFHACSSLTSVTIGNSVETIGGYAFEGCIGLTSVTIPNSVKTIGSSAFESCIGLTSVTIPNSVKTIGSSAFAWCDGLTSVTIPNSVTTIGETAFGGCYNLTSINVDAANTHYCSVDGVLFNYAKDTLIQYPIGNTRNTYTIPSSVTTIGDMAFYVCRGGLTSITIPNSVTTIVYLAFYGCSGLTSINVDAANTHYTSIDGVLFNYAKDTLIQYPIGNTRTIYAIPNSVTTIGDGAFYGCSGLTSVTIPNSVTTIGNHAFSDCSGLTSVTIPNSVITIGGLAFDDCSGLTSVTIGNSVKTIGNHAFSDCSGLTSLTIPNSVTTIGGVAFYNCTGLTSINVDAANTHYTSIDGVLFNYAKDTLIQYPIGNTRTIYAIPNSVTTIGDGAFYGCSGLTSVTIPNSVITIGDLAFSDCSGLTSVTCSATNPPTCENDCFVGVDKSIPLYVPAESIEAYRNAEGWKDFTNIQRIANGAYVTCISDHGKQTGAGFYVIGDTCILTITPNMGYRFTQWSDGNTDNPRIFAVTQDTTFIAQFSEAPIPNNIITYTATSQLGGYNGSLNIGATTFGPAITSHTFSNGIGTITCSGDITTIGEMAFYECTSLTLVTIPNSVTTIGDHAFYNCSGLTSVTIPNSVTEIEDGAFYSCSGLTSPVYNANCFAYLPSSYQGAYSIPTGIKQIAGSAFQGCSGLTSIAIPNSVTTIEYEAFYECTSLTSVTIGNSVTTIGETAFGGCYNLTSINVDAANTHYCSVDGVLFNYAKDTLIQYPIGNTRNTYTIPSSVTTIGDYAFSSCSGLTSVTIPSSVTTIGDRAFKDCNSLTSINVDTTNTHYCSVDGVLFDYAKNTLIQYPIGNTRTFYTIPSSVTTIGDLAFYFCFVLTSVTIPNSVTTIGNYAFSWCSGLTSVTIGNSVKTIGNYAFSYCSGLTSVTIGNSVTTIGDWAFVDCSKLTSVTCYATNPPCGNNCFYDVDKSIPLYVPAESVEAYRNAEGWKDFTNIQLIANGAYVTCISDHGKQTGAGFYVIGDTCILTITPNMGYRFTQWSDGNTDNPRIFAVTQDTTFIAQFSEAPIPNNIITYTATEKLSGYNGSLNVGATIFGPAITSHTFDNGTGTITCSGDITTIGDDAFEGCFVLTSVTIPSSVTTIGSYAFHGCRGLISVTIPSSVTTIGEGAFSLCHVLTSVTIGNSVTMIGDWAFSDCRSLTSVEIPNSVTTIGDEAFFACRSLTSIDVDAANTHYISIDGVLFNYAKDTLIQYPTGNTRTAYTIPSSITKIGGSAFYECSSLTSINVDAANTHYTSIDGVLFNYAKDTLIQYPIGNTRTTYTIPNSVTTIGSDAFSGCSGLASVTIPNSVETIGSYAFYYCRSLTSITIPNSVTTIGEMAFYECTSLTLVTIPNSVKTIGWEAFANCSGLTSVICEAITPPTCGNDCFYGVNKSIPLYVPAESVEAYKNAEGWKDFTDILMLDTSEKQYEYTISSDCDNNKIISIILNTQSLSLKAGESRLLNAITTPSNAIVTWTSSNTKVATVSATGKVTAVGAGDAVITATAGDVSATCNVHVTSAADELYDLNIVEYGLFGAFSDPIPGRDKEITFADGSKYMCELRTVDYVFAWDENVQFVQGTGLVGEGWVCCFENVPFWVIKETGGYVSGGGFVAQTLKDGQIEPYYARAGQLDPETYGKWVQFLYSDSDGGDFDAEYAAMRAKTNGCFVSKNTISWDDAYYNNNYWNGLYSAHIKTFIFLDETDTDDAQFAAEIEWGNLDANKYSYGFEFDTEKWEKEQKISLLTPYASHYNTVTKVYDENGLFTNNAPRRAIGKETTTYRIGDPSKYHKELPQIHRERSHAPARKAGLQGNHTLTLKASGCEDSCMYSIPDNQSVVLQAMPNKGERFDHWSDGNTDNPRTIIVTQDSSLTAIFTQVVEQKCGDNLLWKYEDGTLSIYGKGTMYDYKQDSVPWLQFRDSITTLVINSGATTIGDYAFYGLSNKAFKSLSLPDGIISIGNYAFAECGYLGNISLCSTLEEIGDYAFANDKRLYYVTCYAMEPPLLAENAFYNYDAILSVPCEAKDIYMKVAPGWKKFNQENAKCIGAETVEDPVTEVATKTGDTEVTITWPTNTNATTYTIEISSKGVLVCTLVFNADGILTSINFPVASAPARFAKAVMPKKATLLANGGMQFTVTGLDSGTDYTYIVIIKGEQGQELDSFEGEFKTTGEHGIATVIDEVTDSQKSQVESQKFIQDGVLYIRRNGKTYDAQGRKL